LHRSLIKRIALPGFGTVLVSPAVWPTAREKNRDASLFALGAADASGVGRLFQSVIRQSKIDSIS
jgi:hypothetical protein